MEIAIVILIIAVIFIARSVKVVPQQNAWVKERLGKYAGTLTPGLNFLVPFVDRVAYRHSLKEIPLDVPSQICITKDNTQLQVDGILYFQVTDPMRASYGSSNYIMAVTQLAQTSLRSVIGKLELDKTFEERDTYYYRNQLVLDISNPKVQDYVFGIVDRIMTENPDVAYFKWDCNSVITNIYSPYHKQNQGNFYIDHVRGIYNVLTRIHDKYPNLPMMLCSGGGGRMDYEMLKYFTEFWCSDDTDPYERIYIQWSLSKFFPAKTMGSHVTNWNKNTSVKFRTDVCSSCKLGFDIDLKSLSADDYKFVQQAVKNYNSMKPMILEGDQYRLVSPYEGSHCAINYVSKDKQRAVLFAYDLHPRYKEPQQNVKLQGLDAAKMYTVKETNLMPGKQSDLDCNGKQYSGDYLMKIGLNVFTAQDGTSHVLVLE
jgi:hypothetical protein